MFSLEENTFYGAELFKGNLEILNTCFPLTFTENGCLDFQGSLLIVSTINLIYTLSHFNLLSCCIALVKPIVGNSLLKITLCNDHHLTSVLFFTSFNLTQIIYKGVLAISYLAQQSLVLFWHGMPRGTGLSKPIYASLHIMRNKKAIIFQWGN